MHLYPTGELGEETQAYLDELPAPAEDLPLDVAVILEELKQRLFEPGLKVGTLRKELGLRNNNVTARFRRFVGMGIKEYILYHRLELAKRLLRHEMTFRITEIAAQVGYPRPNTFSTLFRRKVGCAPSQFRNGRVSPDGDTT